MSQCLRPTHLVFINLQDHEHWTFVIWLATVKKWNCEGPVTWLTCESEANLSTHKCCLDEFRQWNKKQLAIFWSQCFDNIAHNVSVTKIGSIEKHIKTIAWLSNNLTGNRATAMRCRATCFLLLSLSQTHQPAFIGTPTFNKSNLKCQSGKASKKLVKFRTPVYKLHFCHQQCFQHFIVFFQRCTYTTSILHTERKEEKQTINHQKRNRCHTFPSPSSCEIMMMFTWEKAVKICWFCSKMRKLSKFLVVQGSSPTIPKTQQNLKSYFCNCGDYSDNPEKRFARIAFSLMSWFESHILLGIVISITKSKSPN